MRQPPRLPTTEPWNGLLGPGRHIGDRRPLLPLRHGLLVDPVALGQSPQALLTMLYRSTDRLCRRGAAVKNLAHSAFLHSCEKSAPSKSGIKHIRNTPSLRMLNQLRSRQSHHNRFIDRRKRARARPLNAGSHRGIPLLDEFCFHCSDPRHQVVRSFVLAARNCCSSLSRHEDHETARCGQECCVREPRARREVMEPGGDSMLQLGFIDGAAGYWIDTLWLAPPPSVTPSPRWLQPSARPVPACAAGLPP